MELKEYIQIIRKDIKTFMAAIAAVILGSFVFFYFRPVSYTTSLTLNITRQGSQNTQDYKFDDFYRLQADEKFADTIVQWLKSPRTVAEIYLKSGVNPEQFTARQLVKYFQAEKLSSQVVSVSFSAGSADAAKKISTAIPEIISKNIDSLNENQKESAWFELIPQEAVTSRDTFDPAIVFVISLAIGIFVAFWVVIILHYLK